MLKISKLKIINYKLFQNVIIEMNDTMNIFVGENDSGKTTILEALSMVLTGKIGGSNIANRVNLDWFNTNVRKGFIEAIKAGNTPALPTIEIEAYFSAPDKDEISTKVYKGTNNSLHEDTEGVKVEILFDTQYSTVYKQLLSDGKIKDIPIEYYKVNFRSFAIPEPLFCCPIPKNHSEPHKNHLYHSVHLHCQKRQAGVFYCRNALSN